MRCKFVVLYVLVDTAMHSDNIPVSKAMVWYVQRAFGL